MTTVNGVTFGVIKNVRKSGNEEGVYFADVELSPQDGFPMETHFYCARSDDYAATGKWVYGEIVAGRHEGGVTQLAPNVDPVTGERPVITAPPQIQPISRGAQTL